MFAEYRVRKLQERLGDEALDISNDRRLVFSRDDKFVGISVEANLPGYGYRKIFGILHLLRSGYEIIFLRIVNMEANKPKPDDLLGTNSVLVAFGNNENYNLLDVYPDIIEDTIPSTSDIQEALKSQGCPELHKVPTEIDFTATATNFWQLLNDKRLKKLSRTPIASLIKTPTPKAQHPPFP